MSRCETAQLREKHTVCGVCVHTCVCMCMCVLGQEETQ